MVVDGRAEDRFDGTPHAAAGAQRGAMGGWNLLVIAAVLVNATFETMLVPAIPLIREDLGLTAPQSAWVLTAFMLAAAVSLPIVGKLGDIFGSERVLTARSEEHTSELQSLMRISYAVFCLKKKKVKIHHRGD